MKQLKQKLMCVIVTVGISLSAVSAQAVLCYDAVRTGEHAAQGAQRTMSLISEYQKVYSKQEELKTWEEKKEIKEEEQPITSGYDYMKKTKPMEMGSEEFLPAEADANEAEKYIRAKFFLPVDKGKITEEEANEVEHLRYAYVEALAKEVLSLSAGVRENASAELNRLKDSKTETGGNIQQIDLLSQTKKTMINQKGADLILQAKLMELEAAEMLLGLNSELVANPDTVKDSGESDSSGGSSDSDDTDDSDEDE